jgi:hypothetical protein
MRVLIACEYSGAVRDAFIRAGHDALSCDILPADAPGPHYQGDVRDILGQPWDLLIAHPPCTYLCSSGLHWNKRVPERQHLTDDAVSFARTFIDGPEVAHIPRRAVENPIGCLSRLVRKPDQIIHPHQFGHDASKATCLWLHGLPPLVPTANVAPRLVRQPSGKTLPRWGNQTDSGQNKLPPSADRWKIRSETYAGIAEAMAAQWGAA